MQRVHYGTSMLKTIAVMLAFFAAEAHAQSSEPVQRPSIGMVKIRAGNLERSLNFYKKVLGMQEVIRYDNPWPTPRALKGDMNGGERIIEVALKFGATVAEAKASTAGTIELVFLTNDKKEFRAPDEEPDFIVNVADLDVTRRLTVENGAKIYLEPIEVVPGTKVMLIVDPSGNVVECIGKTK